MQALALQMFEQQVYVMRERTNLPITGLAHGTIIAPNIDVARRRAKFERITNAIEAVSDKLTSAEYLELYNAAMDMHE